MPGTDVTLLSRWDGFCLPCGTDGRPLALTWTGRRGLFAWLSGYGYKDGELRLTCVCCGSVEIVGWDDEPQPELEQVEPVASVLPALVPAPRVPDPAPAEPAAAEPVASEPDGGQACAHETVGPGQEGHEPLGVDPVAAAGDQPDAGGPAGLVPEQWAEGWAAGWAEDDEPWGRPIGADDSHPPVGLVAEGDQPVGVALDGYPVVGLAPEGAPGGFALGGYEPVAIADDDSGPVGWATWGDEPFGAALEAHETVGFATEDETVGVAAEPEPEPVGLPAEPETVGVATEYETSGVALVADEPPVVGTEGHRPVASADEGHGSRADLPVELEPAGWWDEAVDVQALPDDQAPTADLASCVSADEPSPPVDGAAAASPAPSAWTPATPVVSADLAAALADVMGALTPQPVAVEPVALAPVAGTPDDVTAQLVGPAVQVPVEVPVVAVEPLVEVPGALLADAAAPADLGEAPEHPEHPEHPEPAEPAPVCTGTAPGSVRVAVVVDRTAHAVGTTGTVLATAAAAAAVLPRIAPVEEAAADGRPHPAERRAVPRHGAPSPRWTSVRRGGAARGRAASDAPEAEALVLVSGLR